MAGLLFVSQAMLDSWAAQGKIDFVGNVMTLLAGAGRGRSYALEPAVRFLATVAGADDPHRLLRKVKPLAAVRELGGEAVDASVVLGDVAYDVEPGFLAEASALEAAAAAARAPAPAPSPASPAAAAAAADPAPASASAPAGSAREPRPYARAPLPADLEARRREAEALARFLLDNLS